MSTTRKRDNPEFKAKVTLAALKNEETIFELTARLSFGVHPTMIASWKRTLLDGATEIFDKGQKSNKQTEAHEDELYNQIGRLKVERDLLPKSSICKHETAKADGGAK